MGGLHCFGIGDAPIYGIIELPRFNDVIAFHQKSPVKTTAAPLYETKVYDFYRGAMRSIFEVPNAKRDMVNSQVQKLIQARQQVIVCHYGPSDPIKQMGFQSWFFWYESVPDNIVDMLSSVPIGTHPMRTLGLHSITECPETPELAQKARRAVTESRTRGAAPDLGFVIGPHA